jgi:hypothetical protein
MNGAEMTVCFFLDKGQWRLVGPGNTVSDGTEKSFYQITLCTVRNTLENYILPGNVFAKVR